MKKSVSKEVSYIGISVAMLIVGGFIIYYMSSFLLFPGVKYLLMGPYLSVIIAVVIRATSFRYTVLKINIVFGMIMSIISIYMGLAILLTGILTEYFGMLIVKLVPWGERLEAIIKGSLYSGFTVFTALLIASYLMIYSEMAAPLWWIVTALFINIFMGVFGGILGDSIGKRIKFSRRTQS